MFYFIDPWCIDQDPGSFLAPFFRASPLRPFAFNDSLLSTGNGVTPFVGATSAVIHLASTNVTAIGTAAVAPSTASFALASSSSSVLGNNTLTSLLSTVAGSSTFSLLSNSSTSSYAAVQTVATTVAVASALQPYLVTLWDRWGVPLLGSIQRASQSDQPQPQSRYHSQSQPQSPPQSHLQSPMLQHLQTGNVTAAPAPPSSPSDMRYFFRGPEWMSRSYFNIPTPYWDRYVQGPNVLSKSRPGVCVDTNPAVPGWYATGGEVVTSFVLANTVVTLIMSIIRIPDRFKGWLFRNYATNQMLLNIGYEPPVVELYTQVASLLVSLVVPMVYASAVPAVLFIALLKLIGMFWIEKYNFANVYRKPAVWDARLARASVLIVRYAIVGNLVMAFIAFRRTVPVFDLIITTMVDGRYDYIEEVVSRPQMTIIYIWGMAVLIAFTSYFWSYIVYPAITVTSVFLSAFLQAIRWTMAKPDSLWRSIELLTIRILRLHPSMGGNNPNTSPTRSTSYDPTIPGPFFITGTKSYVEVITERYCSVIKLPPPEVVHPLVHAYVPVPKNDLSEEEMKAMGLKWNHVLKQKQPLPCSSSSSSSSSSSLSSLSHAQETSESEDHGTRVVGLADEALDAPAASNPPAASSTASLSASSTAPLSASDLSSTSSVLEASIQDPAALSTSSPSTALSTSSPSAALPLDQRAMLASIGSKTNTSKTSQLQLHPSSSSSSSSSSTPSSVDLYSSVPKCTPPSQQAPLYYSRVLAAGPAGGFCRNTLLMDGTFGKCIGLVTLRYDDDDDDDEKDDGGAGTGVVNESGGDNKEENGDERVSSLSLRINIDSKISVASDNDKDKLTNNIIDSSYEKQHQRDKEHRIPVQVRQYGPLAVQPYVLYEGKRIQLAQHPASPSSPISLSSPSSLSSSFSSAATITCTSSTTTSSTRVITDGPSLQGPPPTPIAAVIPATTTTAASTGVTEEPNNSVEIVGEVVWPYSWVRAGKPVITQYSTNTTCTTTTCTTTTTNTTASTNTTTTSVLARKAAAYVDGAEINVANVNANGNANSNGNVCNVYGNVVANVDVNVDGSNVRKLANSAYLFRPPASAAFVHSPYGVYCQSTAASAAIIQENMFRSLRLLARLQVMMLYYFARFWSSCVAGCRLCCKKRPQTAPTAHYVVHLEPTDAYDASVYGDELAKNANGGTDADKQPKRSSDTVSSSTSSSSSSSSEREEKESSTLALSNLPPSPSSSSSAAASGNVSALLSSKLDKIKSRFQSSKSTRPLTTGRIVLGAVDIVPQTIDIDTVEWANHHVHETTMPRLQRPTV